MISFGSLHQQWLHMAMNKSANQLYSQTLLLIQTFWYFPVANIYIDHPNIQYLTMANTCDHFLTLYGICQWLIFTGYPLKLQYLPMANNNNSN